MRNFDTKDSGRRAEFSTGSVRDTQEGKDRFDLIPITALRRLAALYARGAEKYGDFNWAKGQPYSRIYASTFRHLMQWAQGETDEDHAAAVVWGMMAVLHFDETGRTDLDDMDIYRAKKNHTKKRP